MGAGLTSCGDKSSSDPTSAEGLAAVTIAGKPGTEPEVTWKSEMTSAKQETKTLETGDGAEIKSGDQVVTHIWIGNGFTQTKAFSTYDQNQPETVTVDDKLSPVFADAILGHTLGSRVAVTTPADKAFGPSGNPGLKIGNKDAVLIVIDLISTYTPPKPVDVPSARLPGLVTGKNGPVALDFTGLSAPKPTGNLLRSVLREGKGPTVTADMTVTANYLGQVYGAKKPFDESYSKKPVPFSLSQVVKGWTLGLSGLTVGTRVLLQIPPDLGYGAQAQTNIPANSTLYFVVDILKAK